MTKGQFIAWDVQDGVALVRFHYVSGFKFEEYDPLEAELAAVADAAGIKAIIVNMDALEYVTSRMLGALTSAAQQARQKGLRLVACRLRPEPLRAFKLTRLDSVIPLYATEDEARQALS